MVSTPYCVAVIREEALQLVQKGMISRQQRIYSLWKYISVREWILVERELEKSNFLLRDRIGDLIGWERWEND